MSRGCHVTPLQPSQNRPCCTYLATPPPRQCRKEISLQTRIALHGGAAATLTPIALHCATKVQIPKPLTRASKRVPGVHGKRGLDRGWQKRLAKVWWKVGEGLAKGLQRVGGFPCTLQFCMQFPKRPFRRAGLWLHGQRMGGGKRTRQCTLQKNFRIPPKELLVWSVLWKKQRHLTGWKTYQTKGGPKPTLGGVFFVRFSSPLSVPTPPPKHPLSFVSHFIRLFIVAVLSCIRTTIRKDAPVLKTRRIVILRRGEKCLSHH